MGSESRSLLFVALILAAASASAAEVASVFELPPADYSDRVTDLKPGADVLRVLSVDERVGLARSSELVRVPLFFGKGELDTPDGLEVYAAEDTDRAHPIVVQSDDIRRGPDGGIARMHLYFVCDLDPWQRKRFVLVKLKPSTSRAAVSMVESGDDVTFKGNDLSVTFRVKGDRAGGMSEIASSLGTIRADENLMAPWVEHLWRQGGLFAKTHEHEVKYTDPTGFEVRSIEFGSGALFAKVRVKVGPRGVSDALESTYMVPLHGTTIVATHRIFPDESEPGSDTVTAKWPVFLWGKVKFGDDPESPIVVSVPAGLRPLSANVHGHRVEAAVSKRAGFAFVNAPLVAFGGRGVYTHPEGELVFMGPGTLHRDKSGNSETIRAWWYQTRYVVAETTTEDGVYDVARRSFQPLTAIVDEPGVEVADLQEAMIEVGNRFGEIKYWGKGWQQDAVIAYLKGKPEYTEKILDRVVGWTPNDKDAGNPAKDEARLEYWAPGWVREQADESFPISRPKGKVETGRLDPYNVGYATGSIPLLARYFKPDSRLDSIAHTIGRASMLTNGGVYDNGFPYVHSFANAYNMQIGTVLFGIYGGEKLGDAELVRFARDVTRSPGVVSIYGHGERSYSGNTKQPGQSDALYQAISDLWLRTIELTCDEDLMIHPAVYGRYSDSVDVTADLQHRSLDETKRASWNRANFFRLQSHDHRWESWDALPYMAMLRDASDPSPAGLTDAVVFAQFRGQHAVNWSELMNFFYPMIALEKARAGYNPPQLPELPRDVTISPASDGKGATVSWSAVDGAAGYRVYRAPAKGEAFTFVNSPYRGGNLVTNTTFTDPDGSTDAFYFVSSVTKDGHESRWFKEEPAPRSGVSDPN